jgi:hypothetical protein
MVNTRDGRSSILTKLKRSKKRDLTRTSASTSTDHSTLFQDYQCKEFVKLMETTMSILEDGSRTRTNRNGPSTV